MAGIGSRIGAVLVVCALAGSVRAGEVTFKNGDRLTGKVEMLDKDELTIDSAVAGKVTVKLEDVATFVTDEPVTIRLQDGTEFKQKINAGPEGQITPEGGAGVAAMPIPLASIRKINPKENWTGSLLVGGLLTKGTNDTEQLNIAFNIARRTDTDRITAGAGYLFGRQEDPDTGDDKTTTDNWFVAGKYDYFFNPRFYAFGGARVERDRIADLDLRFIPSAGVGYQWVESPTFNFSTEGGIAWLYEDYRGEGTQESISLRLAYHVDKEFNDDVSVFHNFAYYPTLESLNDFYFITDLGIRADLTAQMFTEFKVEYRHDATPGASSARNDLRYILGVGWDF